MHFVKRTRQVAETVSQKLGLLALVWVLFQVFVGAGSVWFGGKLFGGGMKAKAIWKYHRLVFHHPSISRFSVLIEDEGYPATSYFLYSS